MTLAGTGGITLNNGSAAQTIASAVVLGSSQTWAIGGSTLAVSGAISGGTASLTLTGPGEVLLTGSNAYTGNTQVNGGVLQLGDGATSNGSVAGNIIDNASLVFANLTAQSYSGTISTSGGSTGTLAGGHPACSRSRPPTATRAARRSAAAPWRWALAAPCPAAPTW